MVDAENTINIRKVLVVNGPNLGRLGVRQPDAVSYTHLRAHET